MMFHSELEKMYQAWQQGNDQYVLDWAYFVQYAARWNKVSYEEMLQLLLQCSWFKRTPGNATDKYAYVNQP